MTFRSKLQHKIPLPTFRRTSQLAYSIPLPWSERERHLAFAEAHGLGLELTAFCSGPALNDTATRRKRQHALKKSLGHWTNSLSYHGVFIDIVLHSIDENIAVTSRRRIVRDLITASDLGCARIVFHTGFNPNVPAPEYWGEVVNGHGTFWPDALERFPGITVCLENTYEPHPTLLQHIMEKANHPRLRVCLDVAHVHAFSHDSLERWFCQLEPWIEHMHWNDNRGDRDSHLAIGEGSVCWQDVWEKCADLRRKVTATLELESLDAIQRSFQQLSRWGMWGDSDTPP